MGYSSLEIGRKGGTLAEFRKKPSSDSSQVLSERVRVIYRPRTSTMVTRPHSSAVGVLALLADPEPLLKQHALQSLVPLVPQFWAEISEHIALMYVPNTLLSQ